jgi:hypothetical protein
MTDIYDAKEVKNQAAQRLIEVSQEAHDINLVISEKIRKVLSAAVFAKHTDGDDLVLLDQMQTYVGQIRAEILDMQKQLNEQITNIGLAQNGAEMAVSVQRNKIKKQMSEAK